MMTLKTALASGAMTALALIAAPASAAPLGAMPVTTDYTIVSDPSIDGNVFSGTFSLTNDAGRFSLSAFSGSFGGYAYGLPDVGLDQSFGQVQIGGKNFGVSALQPRSNDFLSGYISASYFATPTGSVLGKGMIATPASMSGWVTMTIAPVVAGAVLPVSAVPEPATWAMMLVGFGLIGATARYRRRTTTIRYA